MVAGLVKILDQKIDDNAKRSIGFTFARLMNQLEVLNEKVKSLESARGRLEQDFQFEKFIKEDMQGFMQDIT